jgi:hypothetical protein
MKRAAVLASFLVLQVAHAADAPELGRLFHTPQQRKALDASRTQASQPPKASAAKPLAKPRPAHLEGYVVRPDGRSTVWIGGHAVRVPPKEK